LPNDSGNSCTKKKAAAIAAAFENVYLRIAMEKTISPVASQTK